MKRWTSLPIVDAEPEDVELEDVEPAFGVMPVDQTRVPMDDQGNAHAATLRQAALVREAPILLGQLQA